MASKRTYSRHNMSIAEPELRASDPDNIHHEANKRRKPTPPSPVGPMPQSHVLNGGGRPRSMKQKSSSEMLQKNNSKKRFSGPTTLPGDEMDPDDSEQKTDPFDSVLALAQTRQAPQQPRGSIYGGGRTVLNSISAQLKSRKREKKKETQVHFSDDLSVDGGIQFPPHGESEIPSLGSDDLDFPMEGSPAVNVTMRGGSALNAAEASARVFNGRQYSAPQTAPPRRTLWGVRMQTDSAEALGWSANQTNASLLRLPANVRRRIYDYALGGNSIEFGHVTYLVEKRAGRPNRCVPYFQYTSNVYDDRRNPFQGFKTFLKDNPRVEGMTLLNGICRQLYYETYTLPYALNDFYFNSGNALFNFLVKEDRLQPQQCQAIKSIVILHRLPAPAVLEKLSNLEHVLLMAADVPMANGHYKVVRGSGVADGRTRGDFAAQHPSGVQLVKYQPTSKLTKPTIRGGHGYGKFTHPYARR
ncbi:uncharacterized protein N0V89_003358 [Didymosphaeria variabile]|uniref:DUF7730 domain-containing protein n=1 Tax=Didymosphaeria variabile TaxID=1932322 RepID=A0A9W8XUD9_9PLEO|nr:uncharacterized protein N0V89_003358 [Didymosphaeria variabile]KAJ4358774.1 hypothetical protein N0V89_003358 [Didymosphaeria variabile]